MALGTPAPSLIRTATPKPKRKLSLPRNVISNKKEAQRTYCNGVRNVSKPCGLYSAESWLCCFSRNLVIRKKILITKISQIWYFHGPGSACSESYRATHPKAQKKNYRCRGMSFSTRRKPSGHIAMACATFQSLAASIR